MEMGDLQSIVWHSSLRAISRSRRNASASRRLTSPRLTSSSRLSSLIAGRRELETREPAQKELRDRRSLPAFPARLLIVGEWPQRRRRQRCLRWRCDRNAVEMRRVDDALPTHAVRREPPIRRRMLYPHAAMADHDLNTLADQPPGNTAVDIDATIALHPAHQLAQPSERRLVDRAPGRPLLHARSAPAVLRPSCRARESAISRIHQTGCAPRFQLPKRYRATALCLI